MNNPIEFIKSIKNPKNFLINKAKKMENPMITNLINMGEKGNEKGVENFARNVFKEQGRDFDKEFNQFMSNFR